MSLRTIAMLLTLLVGLPRFAAADVETGKLTVRVLDAEAGQPMPARLVLRAADGTYPGDRVGLLAKSWPNIEAHAVFISGEQAFDLPPGMTRIAAGRGPQYEVEEREVEVIAGKAVTVEVKLRRQLDLRKLGWVAGDAHLHMIHGEMQRKTSYADVALTCRANGLDWATVAQEYVGSGTLDATGYRAECAKASSPDFRLMLGGERPKSLLGHNVLINIDDPFTIADDPPYHAAARDIHARDGVLFPVHPVRYFPEKKWMNKWQDFPGNNLGREILFDAYLGPSFDGLSVLSDEPGNRNAHQLWFNLLNKGFRVPAMSDSDACFDRPTLGRNTPGFWLTYLNVGPDGKTDGPSLAEAIRQGRTMATTGPLLQFSIDGKLSGATLPPDGRPREVAIEVFHDHNNWTLGKTDPAGAPVAVSKVELIRNGVVAKTWEPKTPHAKIAWTIKETSPSWYVVRAYGSDARWQIAAASPIYFAEGSPPAKRPPLTVRVRGRIYDFETGKDRDAAVQVRRGSQVLKTFEATGQFAADVPLDGEIVATDAQGESVAHDLLHDYGPVHQFLWKLTSEDLGKAETLDRFEALVKRADLEFPLGHRMAGCYAAAKLSADAPFESVKIVEGPPAVPDGSIAVAAALFDKRVVAPGDVIHLAAIFRDERGPDAPGGDMLLVVEGLAFDPARPTGFNPLKPFGAVESKWSKATDLGQGYRMIAGKLTVPAWATAGPVGAVEIGVRSRFADGRDGGRIGMLIPLGTTSRALMSCSGWPTMPLSWPDHNYGIGPLNICGKNGRLGQPRADYRSLHLSVKTAAGAFDLLPARDGRGCPDADDAVYVGHFFDMVLNDESKLATPDVVRPQPEVNWRQVPVIDATNDAGSPEPGLSLPR